MTAVQFVWSVLPCTYVCVSLWSEQRSMADACCVSVRLSEWQGQ